jgi:hypothetical protein
VKGFLIFGKLSLQLINIRLEASKAYVAEAKAMTTLTLPLTVDLNQVHLTDEHCAVGL